MKSNGVATKMCAPNEDVIYKLEKMEDSIKIFANNENKDSHEGKNIVNSKCITALLSNGSLLYNNIDINRISVVNVSGCTLNEIPCVFEHLNLKELRLSKVGLKNVPVCLYKGLRSLEILDLSFNELNDFDVEPKSHSTLKYLYLNNNNFTNVPQWILALRAHSLQELDYSNNKVTELKCLLNKYDIKLSILKMRNCCLRNIDLQFFKNIDTLKDLDISNEVPATFKTNIFDDVDELFVKVTWKEMTTLNLNNLSLSIVPRGIVWLESLVELNLRNNNLSWLPEGMEYLINLTVLDVSENDLTYFPEGFFLLTQLKVIKAANNNITEFQDLSLMQHLEVLDLYCNSLEALTDYANVKLADFELNYVDTETCSFYIEYTHKRNTYRKTLSIKRLNGPQLKPNIPLSVSSSPLSAISDSDNFLEIEYEDDRAEFMQDENWDEPYTEIKEKHPDITSSDDEWIGDSGIPLQTTKFIKNLNRIYDDDWMFCDAEDVS